ncbi:hypothetical protein [Microbacterium sp.]|uniref:hypothetical protein n=1 Tax=Microbacterium sp. TaxID=51671 RepID=UPI0028AF2EFD|nr:hypothetical protein [Microbacterium sp.]
MEDERAVRRQRLRRSCVSICWTAVALGMVGWVLIVLELFGSGLRLALTGQGMEQEAADTTRAAALVITMVCSATTVAAAITRRWVLLPLSLLLVALGVVLLAGEINTT